ncbi:DUF6283 family protein [Spirillospora sp. CA-255316]
MPSPSHSPSEAVFLAGMLDEHDVSDWPTDPATVCRSCPYRRDAPSRVWATSEYEKLPRYDAAMLDQPDKVFLRHQHDGDAEGRRSCAGWVGCHDAPNPLSLRIAVLAAGPGGGKEFWPGRVRSG